MKGFPQVTIKVGEFSTIFLVLICYACTWTNKALHKPYSGKIVEEKFLHLTFSAGHLYYTESCKGLILCI